MVMKTVGRTGLVSEETASEWHEEVTSIEQQLARRRKLAARLGRLQVINDHKIDDLTTRLERRRANLRRFA